uniref:SREBP regulating gene protein n=1 Tax=Oryza punctata TaxID=4537 RepID=A0A0E0MEL1_ORYPU
MATTGLPLLLPRIVCASFFACLPALVAGIRKDIGLAAPIMCRSTVQGRHLISDDNGYVCSSLSIDPWSRCCPRTGPGFGTLFPKFCTHVGQTKEADVLKLKELTEISSISAWEDVAIVLQVHENAYASDFHHCFLLQQNSSGSADYGSGPRLDGINISIGRRGESCSSVCRAKGQSCVPSRLSVLNKCEILQKYMRCKSGCFSSLGPDQPAQVVDEAPSNLNPGACLYMQMDERLTCDGSHQHTRRLCPCA